MCVGHRDTMTVPLEDRATSADVAYVLMLLQAAFGVVATLGMVLLMGGSVVHAIVPLLFAVALLVVAAKVARRRRWALIAALVVESAGLGGLMLDVVLGTLRQVDYVPTLTGLLTTVALPVAVIVLCVRSLADGA
jgi:hypothetical protein